jgi:hypothetical protein
VKIVFKDICLEDKLTFEKYYNAEVQRGESLFLCVYTFRDYYKTKISIHEDFVILQFFFEDNAHFTFLTNDCCHISQIQDLVKEYCSGLKTPELYFSLIAEHIPYFQNYVVEEDRVWSDYIYRSESLVTFRGKDLQPKRNFVNRFLRNNYEVIEYTEEYYKDAIGLYDIWVQQNGIDNERVGIIDSLQNYQYLGVKIFLVYVDKNIVGFSISDVSSNTPVTLFEKGNTNYDGIYPFLVQEAAKRYYKDFKYVNREDDMGLPNLRKSKLSYCPEFMLIKYTAKEKEL